MLRFNQLRLAGFKSFVDNSDVTIEMGLTGIVGPNGCGKSNLVEALRWVMGETSAKQIRGSEMDDVIFSGTASRPARNIAEVVLALDNNARVAPAQFNDADELEISRRIERGSGSTYRINGKEVRARDVQLLFADAATGARSNAMVSQGKVSAVIAAKPVDRRLLLEEAAGIRGLHARRHEAELRLRGADTNLTRLDDILVTLETQLKGLKKQARQATRYRNLSDHIRRAEATLFLLRWADAADELENGRRRLAEAETRVTELTGLTGQAATRQAEAAAAVPELRQAEAEAAARLQNLIIARDGLEAEEQRIVEARADCENRLQQVIIDRERERTLASDADAAIERLDAERNRLQAAQDGEEDARREAAQALSEASAKADVLEGRLAALVERTATEEARRASLKATLAETADRKDHLAARAAQITQQKTTLESEAADSAARGEVEAALADAANGLSRAHLEADSAEEARARTERQAAETASALHQAESAVAGLQAEVRALSEILEGSDDAEPWPALLDAVTVEAGAEIALAAALGDDLAAPADQPAPVHWRTLSPFDKAPPLPAGAIPMDRLVQGPSALIRRLSQIGVVTDEAEGDRLRGKLHQGQRLVSRDGALWRWDGYTVSAAAATGASSRLEQRNRLEQARDSLIEAEEKARAAAIKAATARSASEQAVTDARAARQGVQDADAEYARARDTLGEIKERTASHASRFAALTDAAAAAESDLLAVENLIATSRAGLAELPDPDVAREAVAEARTLLAESRDAERECRAAHDILFRASEERLQRTAALAEELESWHGRKSGAEQRLEELDQRERAVDTERARLEALPAEIAERRRTVLDKIETAEAARNQAADRLAEAENRLGEADRGLRAAEATLAQAREQRVRAEGEVEQSRLACTALTERIADRLECEPDQLRELTGLKEDAELPELEAIERKVERLHRERETMGPVNLRAEQEAREIAEQMETLDSERGDLIKAIEKLRQGINQLNREGRERLLASFKEVDEHFQELFVRLFGGGRAHLSLVDSDDPLEAGLEIMASPPGKRLQALSLLSGGEQALTALALLFAVFLTNPAPICVLDEVDAPLDDANVDRFCTLLDEMSKSGDTRFLVITHHRMTMARMDRLFGITMGERGVSQMVSVDLQKAEELRATA